MRMSQSPVKWSGSLRPLLPAVCFIAHRFPGEQHSQFTCSTNVFRLTGWEFKGLLFVQTASLGALCLITPMGLSFETQNTNDEFVHIFLVNKLKMNFLWCTDLIFRWSPSPVCWKGQPWHEPLNRQSVSLRDEDFKVSRDPHVNELNCVLFLLFTQTIFIKVTFMAQCTFCYGLHNLSRTYEHFTQSALAVL